MIQGGKVTLLSGRTFNANMGTLGIRFSEDPNSDSSPPVHIVSEGSDYRIDIDFTPQEKHEIAQYMAIQWLAWAGEK